MGPHQRFAIFAVVLLPTLSIDGRPALGDIPRAMAERQRAEATHIIRGHVREVYTAERESTPGHVDTLYVIEIVVDKVDKGTGASTDKPLYVRGWKSKLRPAGFDGPTGQTTIPRPFDQVWVYFRANRDGGYDLLEPNGIEIFREKKA